MSERTWSEKQRWGFEARGGSLLVSAAAGSGKTSVLVQRILERITGDDGVDISRLLVVTFTRAAAAEMRQRLSVELTKLSAAHPENWRYQRQLMLLPTASISTVHGFCANLLREQAGPAGLPLDFQVAEDFSAAMLAEQALDEVMEEAYQKKDPAFMALAAQLNTHKSDRDLRQAVQETYLFIKDQPQPEKWLREKVGAYTAVVSPEKTDWYKPLWQELQYLVGEALPLAREAYRLVDTYQMKGYFDACFDDLRQAKALAALTPDTPYSQVYALATGWTAVRLKNMKLTDPEALAARPRAKELRDKVKALLTRAAALFPGDEEHYRRDLARLAPPLEALETVTLAYDRRFTQLKRRQKLLDYHDLEHECLKLLQAEDGSATPLARELSTRYTEIMVDEYQDTNGAQDALFRLLSRGDNLFMVGDIKQSIYGFRNAMPSIFTDKRSTYATYQPDSPEFPATITLEENYRSRRQVTDTVNFLFDQIMQRELGGVAYGAGEALRCAATYPEGDGFDTEWLLVDRAQDEQPVDNATAEATVVARRIRQLCAETTVGREGQQHPVSFSDICILMRTRTHMNTYATVLAEHGIPLVVDASESFLQTAEISTAMSLLRVIDNPLREVELAAVMMSPLYGFTPDDMAAVKLAGGGVPLYTALSKVEEPALAAACRRLLEDLARYRTLAVSLSADRLIERLLRDSSLLPVFAARPGGEQRVANLRQLDQLARGYERGGFRGLSGFVRYVDRMADSQKDFAAGTTQQANGVRLMTVHGSKGLEFPVVILAQTNVSSKGDVSRLRFHHQAGIGLKLMDEDDFDLHTTLPFTGVVSARMQDACAEEIRVWYVAMTRASEKLIVAYTAKDMQAKLESLGAALPERGPLPPSRMLYTGVVGDWLLSAALRHESFIGWRGAPHIPNLPSDSPWKVVVETLADDAAEEERIPIPVEDTPPMADEALAAILQQRLDYVYPYAPLAAVPAKLAASQLSHEAMQREYIAKSRPAFMQKAGLTPAQKGTALHTFMQFADLAAAARDLTAEIARLVAVGFLADYQAAALDRDKITAFLTGGLYARMAASPDCKREYHFFLSVPAGTLEDLPPELAQEPVMVQGIADCVFREGDGLVLVDYKTDRVKTPEELADRYCSQMGFYKQALEPLLGLPVREVLLYSFHLGQTVNVDI